MPHCGCFPLQALIISNMGYYFCNHHNKNWLDRDPSTDNNSNVRLAAVLHCYTEIVSQIWVLMCKKCR